LVSARRNIQILIVVLIACNMLFIQVNHVSRVSAQPPPYPPLAPSLFRVVGTSWGSSNLNSSIYAAPGDMNIPLFVTVQNIGNRTATGLSETLVLQEPFTNVSGGRTVSAFYAQDISPGLTATTQFILNIARNASLGVHVLKMETKYLQIVSGVGATLYLNQQISVDLPVLITGTSYATIYSVNLYPSETTPGGNVTISGTIVDTATALLSNTNVSFSSPAFSRGTFIYVGEADPNIPRPFSVTVQVLRTIAEGTYPVEIAATYLDSLGITHITSFRTTLRVIQQVYTPAARSPERGPIEVALNILREIFRFFFGSFGFSVLSD